MADDDMRPVMTVVRSRLRADAKANGYGEVATRMEARARSVSGFVDFTTFTATDGERLSRVAFDTPAHRAAWRDDPEHRAAQRRGGETFYAEHSVTVCREDGRRELRPTAVTRPGDRQGRVP